MKNKILLFITLFISTFILHAQEDEFANLEQELESNSEEEKVTEIFNSTRIINGHSTETLSKGVLEFRVEHRFGDIAGPAGGVQTMFGLDNSADIRIAFEYGLTDKMMIGIGRNKGANNPYRSLIDGFYKYRFLQQKKGESLFSMAVIGTASYTYMKASTDSFSVAFFPKQEHRFAYAAQLNIARKFGEHFSFALMPTMVHRNYVNHDDLNTLFSLGAGTRIGLTETMAILLEYYHCFHDPNLRPNSQNSLGIAFEWITFGHNFTINFTNSRGFGETQYIPGTISNWLDGQFRLGFTIGRKFEW